MLKKENIEDIYPLSPIQEGLFFHWLYDQQDSAYFFQLSYRIKGSYKVEVVETALEKLVARYDVLRTVFINKSSARPIQVVLKKRDVDFHYEDITHLKDQASHLKTFRETDKARLFDLSKDMLMRVALFKLDDEYVELMWSFHHIIMDGWCMDIIRNDFHHLYQETLEGKQSSLPQAPKYKTYLDWLEERETEDSRAFWSNYLEGIEKPTGLAALRNHTSHHTVAASPTNELFLSKEQSAKMVALARKNHVSLSTIIQGIWSTMLSCYNQCDDVTFGVVVSGRPSDLVEAQTMIGPFINTVPMRVKCQSNTSFSKLISTIQVTTAEVDPHAHLSLAEIQSMAPVRVDLIDHILVFYNLPSINEEPEENSAEDFGIDVVDVVEKTHYGLNVSINYRDTFLVKFTYDETIYSGKSIDRMMGHFESVLNQVLANDQSELSTISLLTPSEEALLTNKFGKGAEVPGMDQTILEAFETQVNENPTGISALFNQEKLTYQELQIKSDKLAHYLRTEHEIGKGDFVAIIQDRSLEVLISILGVLKTGAAYLPIDPANAADRIQFMIEDTAAKLVITDSQYVLDLNFYRGTLFAADLQMSGLPTPAQSFSVDIDPTDTAYIIYTSGSTGTPKGVQVAHQGVINLAQGQKDFYGLTKEDHQLQFASLSFDASVAEIFSTLLNGATLIMISKEVIHHSRKFVTYLKQQEVTLVTLPPSFLSTFDLDELKFLRVINTAGEAAIPKDAKYLSGSVKYINSYGPTECSVHVSAYEVPTDCQINGSLPIGRPMQNFEVLILDPKMKLVPVGVEGELCVAGIGLSKGYLNEDQLTEEKFVPHPFDPEKMIYRTGDIARWLPDGNLEFIGRTDRQVKLRGYRIELAEIERCMLQYESITDAAVIIHGRGDQSSLCAYFVTKETMKTSELRKFMETHLPHYMIPSSFTKLDKLPLNINGKLETTKLPAPESSALAGKEITPPEGTFEIQLLEIWQDVLQSEDFGVTDHFFEVGGHSLKAVRLAARIENELGRELGVKEIFDLSTIREIARHLEKDVAVYEI